MQTVYYVHTPFETVAVEDPDMAEFLSRQGARVTAEVH